MIDKDKVKYRFKRSVESYDRYAYVQKAIVEELCGLLRRYIAYTPEKILEIGCGTGLLTQRICRNIKYNELYINDLVDLMCYRTADICDIDISHCLIGDMEELPLEENFDLIVSSSTFQWFSNLSATFEKLSCALAPEGMMLFSTFGNKNLWELRSITGTGLHYHTKKEICEMLAPHFNILFSDESFHAISFSDSLEILQHLKKTGVNAIGNPDVWTRGQLQAFATEYKTRYFFENKYPLTYHPLYFVCEKR